MTHTNICATCNTTFQTDNPSDVYCSMVCAG